MASLPLSWLWSGNNCGRGDSRRQSRCPRALSASLPTQVALSSSLKDLAGRSDGVAWCLWEGFHISFSVSFSFMSVYLCLCLPPPPPPSYLPVKTAPREPCCPQTLEPLGKIDIASALLTLRASPMTREIWGEGCGALCRRWHGWCRPFARIHQAHV